MNANEFLSMDAGQDDRLSELSGCLPCLFEVCHGLIPVDSFRVFDTGGKYRYNHRQFGWR